LLLLLLIGLIMEEDDAFEMIVRGSPGAPPPPPPPPGGVEEDDQLHIEQVYLVFSTSTETRREWYHSLLKRYVSHLSGGMNHVEFVFQWSNKVLWACACNMDGPVEMKHRDTVNSYNAARWAVYPLNITLRESQLLWQFCERQCGKEYNYRGLYGNFLCWGMCGTVDQDHRKWFCSHLVMAALQYAKRAEFGRYVASKTNIGDLFNIVDRHQCFEKDKVIVMGDLRQYPLRFPGQEDHEV
jgi:hypothetical protein